MTATPKPFTVAVVQAAPVFLDREATVAKACALIADAAARGAKLVVLPEAFIPAYPAWVWFLPMTRRAEIIALYRELVENAVDVPGPVTEALGAAARAAGAWVAIGVNERNSASSASTLYNTILMFDDQGSLVEHRRKLMPTGAERMVWSPGAPVPIRVHDTPLGRLGGLLCWENYMPLARFSLYEQNMQVLIAPTWDKSDPWIATMRHIAREGRVYVIGCCQALHRDQVPNRYAFKSLAPADLLWLNNGNSLVVDPEGAIVAGPLSEKEGTLLVEIDPGKTAGSRWIFDAVGHYNRPDLFGFKVHGAAESAPEKRGAPRKPAKTRSASRPKVKTRKPTPARRTARRVAAKRPR
jgi:nitrilase